MARCRNIKPAFFRNEVLAAATPHARLLFIGLWCLADPRGLLEDRRARIKADVFPYEPVDIDSLIMELVQCVEPDGTPAFLRQYTVAGRDYLAVENFHRHQHPT